MTNMGAIMILRSAAVVLAAACLYADWNPRLAADYLDSRQKQWFEWKPAASHGGPCVSCHTGATYLLARPALRRALGESTRTSYETGLLDALRARLDPFPSTRKEPGASQAMGVEAVHSALFLAIENSGKKELSADATRAFARLWSLQIAEGKAKGSWAWFSLKLDPWEMPDSAFYGVALAALATGYTPASYRSKPDVRERVSALTGYLDRELATQPLHNRLMLLWASSKLPESLPRSKRKQLLKEILKAQNEDGGWTMASLGPWAEHSAAPPASGTNAYATAFVAFTLKQSGLGSSNPKMARALAWLRAQQNAESGYWAADSMNKRYEAGSVPLFFMRDAATAYAALALLP
jgi:squalene-hopene/tetraprenyl-beta-curcumene cyclase